MLRCPRRQHHGSDKWDCAVTVQHVWGGAKASGGELQEKCSWFCAGNLRPGELCMHNINRGISHTVPGTIMQFICSSTAGDGPWWARQKKSLQKKQQKEQPLLRLPRWSPTLVLTELDDA